MHKILSQNVCFHENQIPLYTTSPAAKLYKKCWEEDFIASAMVTSPDVSSNELSISIHLPYAAYPGHSPTIAGAALLESEISLVPVYEIG